LMSSRTVSTVSLAFSRVKPLPTATASMMSALVRVPVWGLIWGLLSVGIFMLQVKGLVCQLNLPVPRIFPGFGEDSDVFGFCAWSCGKFLKLFVKNSFSNSLILLYFFTLRNCGKIFYFLLKFVDLKWGHARQTAGNLRIKKPA
jgi:hypothetical protein